MGILDILISLDLEKKAEKYKPEHRSLGILLEIFKENKEHKDRGEKYVPIK